MTRRIVRLATLALATVVLALLRGGAVSAATPLPQAPDFRLTLLDGKILTLANLKGKPAVVTFWWSK